MNSKLYKIGAVVIAILFLGSIFVFPMSGAVNLKNNKISENKDPSNMPIIASSNDGEIRKLDTYYVPEEDIEYVGEENDVGYNTDSGDTITRAFPLYVGEPVDQTKPGRGRAGSLDVSGGDDADWYRFTVCKGQSIQASVTGSFSIALADHKGSTVSIPYTAVETDNHFVSISGGDGDYTFSVSLTGQNDAGKGSDAGNSIGQAMSITPGSYTGYMSYNDQEDWYSFSANSGQGIFITVKPLEKSDYDIHLYNPSGNYVHSALYYGDDTLEYPADATGTWKFKLDMFPGWDASKWPDNYYLYGSGAYELTLSVGGSAETPPGPIPQPDITPVAQTFIVNNQKTSSKDEFGYLAAVPAANYLSGGERYLSPIVYQGENYVSTWFTTVDQTTQYLLDDWNTYLANNGKTAQVYNIPDDPVTAAANIARDKFSSYNTAVIAVDGSSFEDEIVEVLSKDSSLTSQPMTTTVKPGEFKFELDGISAYPMLLMKNWGAVHLIAKGSSFTGDTGVITPNYYGIMEDWWPYPYPTTAYPGPDYDTFFPITRPGIWMPYVTTESGLEELQILKYKADRYSINVDDSSSSIKVKITTNSPSNLMVYLIDPEGYVRRPAIPHYNGGEINPIHIWNGGHWLDDYDEFRAWKLEPHTNFEVEVNNPAKGAWTAIVVPFLDENGQDIGFSGSYHISATLRNHNPKRLAAELSAANAAVIASLKHAPLLYVTETSVPSATQNALSGVSTKIFVNINSVSSANPGATTTYDTMQEVIDAIKADSHSENYITITSLASEDGYFAPAAMAAAYHGSPVLDFGEAQEAYDLMDRAATFREYAGDFYHGSRSLGYLPDHKQPLSIDEVSSWIDIMIYYFTHGKTFPPLGLDLDLTWMQAIHDGVYDMINNYGLDETGQEAYLFVGNRDYDIRDMICRIMMGTESYTGHIPVKTAAFSSDVIVRDLLYPALIYANPGRDVTTSQLMNFPDGTQWKTNDGANHNVYSSREIKKSFSSHDRFYEGHCLWDNLLSRYNEGASICYYSGHGTGGAGISAQYSNVNDLFPYAELKHENLKDFDWWDAWRGYMYDDEQTKDPRWGGFTWFNSEEPNLYDFIHFKWADQEFENLHSIFDLWMSCTTQAHYGPIVYLSHGAALCFGNAATGLCPQADLLDDNWMADMLEKGDSIGESLSRYWWLHQRDYTAKPGSTEREKSIYGSSSMQVTNMQVIFADPTITLYSPEWTQPIPINAP